MRPFSPDKLIILDYSGTLSLEAPRFAKPASLVAALAESGLAKLGVATPELFWGEIVGPTWTTGSTTTIGYRQVVAQRIEALATAPETAGAEIAVASSRFVDLYLAHSRIDPLWRPLLEALPGDPGRCVVIATDHYAEATETIIRNLRLWNIPAIKTAEKTNNKNKSAVPACLIANSADIGFWKKDRRFWETVKFQLGITAVGSILMIDDFGFNEEQGESGAERNSIEGRRSETAASLQSVFQASLSVIPFFLESGERNQQKADSRIIAQTVRKIDRYLKTGGIGMEAS